MLKIQGMQQLVDRLEKMEDAGKRASNVALKKAGEVVKAEQVEQAKKIHNKYSEHIGYNEIKKYQVKVGKTGKRTIDIGLKAPKNSKSKKKNSASTYTTRTTHWDKIKGLVFNNYGFYHNRTGQYVAGSNWMGKAYDNSCDEAYRVMTNEIIKELGL